MRAKPEEGSGPVEGQRLPVRVYQTDDLWMIAAPMPGLEPEDITIELAGNRVTIRGEERGPGQHGLDLLTTEWTIGPYFRELELPGPVDPRQANATYGNGVLVLSLPKSRDRELRPSAKLRLTPIAATRGEHVGRRGHPDP